MSRLFSCRSLTPFLDRNSWSHQVALCSSSAISDKFYGKVDVKWNEVKKRKGARRPKLAKNLSKADYAMIERDKEFKAYWHPDPVLMTSPLAKNLQPVNQWAEEEEALKEQQVAKSQPDAPLWDLEDNDPYKEEPLRCILCPKNYAIDIKPSWKNPKLLSQFVSPHTGLVYKKHITGLCEFMQDQVEKEVKKAQAMGKFIVVADNSNGAALESSS